MTRPIDASFPQFAACVRTVAPIAPRCLLALGVSSLELRSQARILCCEPADSGPIEALAALGKQAQKSIMQQASERHGNAKTFGRGQREPDVLESERCSEACRLELALGDQAAINLVDR